MRKVFQLRLTCCECRTVQIVAGLPFRTVEHEAYGIDGREFECPHCKKNNYEVRLQFALMPADAISIEYGK